LEHRLSRLEITVKDLAKTADVLTKRVMALQAQLDHLDARIGRH
jgi:hypothetical protein